MPNKRWWRWSTAGIVTMSLVTLMACSSAEDPSLANAADTGAPSECSDPMQIGITYQADAAASVAAFIPALAKDLPTDAQIEAEIQQTVDHVNETGGFNGCQIEPIYRGVKFANADAGAEEQALCVDFTEDHDVAVALAFFVTWAKSEDGCLSSRGIPQYGVPGLSVSPGIDRSLWLMPQIPDGTSADTQNQLIDTMVDAGAISPEDTVGLFYSSPTGDDSIQKIIDDAWKPALAQRGIKVGHSEPFPISGSASASQEALENAGKQCPDYALKAKDAGVDTLIATEGLSVVGCAQSWAAQDFAPRIVILNGGPLLIQTGSSSLLAALLGGAMAKDLWVASTSTFDLGGGGLFGGYDAWPAANREKQQQCVGIVGDHVANKLTGPMTNVCEWLLFLQAAFAHAPAMDAKGLQAGIEALGTYDGFSDGWGPLAFGPGRTFGVNTVQVIKYDPDKKTFASVGEPKQLS